MENKNMVSWDVAALHELNSVLENISDYSPQHAVNVLLNIEQHLQALTEHPEKYHPDKYKLRNDGNCRAFELHRIRISYQVSNNQIRILRVRHTRQAPEKY